MALTQELFIPEKGVTYPEAYHVINQVVTVNKQSITLNVFIYASKIARDNGAAPEDYRTIVLPFQEIVIGSNPIEQGYMLLKTWEEYEGADDA